VRVRVYPAEAEAQTSLPQVAAMQPLPGTTNRIKQVWLSYFAGGSKPKAHPQEEPS